MARIVVIGGTGYTGSAVVQEAVDRGHEVTSFSRLVPEDPVEGAAYETGSVLDPDDRTRIVADVVIATVAPRGAMAGKVVEVDTHLVELAGAAGARIGVVGGEVALYDDEGRSELSAADFAIAIVDEIEQPRHQRKLFSLAY